MVIPSRLPGDNLFIRPRTCLANWGLMGTALLLLLEVLVFVVLLLLFVFGEDVLLMVDELLLLLLLGSEDANFLRRWGGIYLPAEGVVLLLSSLVLFVFALLSPLSLESWFISVL